MYIGFKALETQFDVKLVQPLRVESSVGTVRSRWTSPELTRNQYPWGYTPSTDFAGHFEFGLKYEDIHLEFLARLFAVVPSSTLEAWCRKERYGQYARRAGFFYEWLTGHTLDVPDLNNGAYLDVLQPDRYVVRSAPVRNRRWRLNDNLPGTAAFCPLIRRTPALQEALNFDPAAALADLNRQFGADLLMRSASWLTLKESRASFLIEREADQTDRIKRFAHVIAEHCGKLDDPLSNDSLRILQAGILGKDTLSSGLRRSPVFVGQSTIRDDVVHYVAPHWNDVSPMLAGLKEFESATRGQEPVVRAGTLAFAFVYIHPMSDGNGRIHRFLINDTLLRDGAIPNGVVLPVSASITSSVAFRAGYDNALDVFSRPLMRRYAEAYRFGEMTTAEDGTRTNFVFDAYADANFAWRYPDLTSQVIYTASVIAHTIQVEMADEARVLLRFRLAEDRIKDVIEMPSADAHRIIRAIHESGGRVSGKLKRDYPALENALLALRLVETVQSAFEDRDPLPIVSDDDTTS
jgi:hypothetical protein